MNRSSTDRIAEQDAKVSNRMQIIKRVIIVMSGKGGVGKTSVAVNLAYALALSGKNVGLFDTDFHGPNVAKMLGIETQTMEQGEEEIIPVQVSSYLKVVSLSLLGGNPDTPIIWRGPIKTAMIRQFLGGVNWGALDYLIIDSPPGTGDEPLSVCQFLSKNSEVLIVTTPQDVAVLDARKSIVFAKELNIPIIGVIENMSGLTCPHCRVKIALFNEGGGARAAKALHVPFLGSIPFDPDLVSLSDQGKPFIVSKKDSEAAKAFREIIIKIENEQ